MICVSKLIKKNRTDELIKNSLITKTSKPLDHINDM